MTQRNGAALADPFERRIDIQDRISPLDIAAMLRVLWHGKWLILFAIFCTVAVAGYYAFRIAPPQYSATATLQLDGAGDPPAGIAPRPGTNDTALNTAVALVTSDPVLDDVIDALDLLSDPEFNRYLLPTRPFSPTTLRTRMRHWLAGTTEPSPDAAAIRDKTIQNLRRTLHIARQSDTYILSVTARSGDPDKAVALANTTAARYLAHNTSLQMQAHTQAEDWLQSRANALRAQLEMQEMQAADLVASAQIQGDGALDDLIAQVLAADQDLIAAETAIRLLEQGPESGTARNRAEITQLRTKITDITTLKERRSTQLSAQSAGLAALHQIELQIDETRQLYQTFLARLHENSLQQGLVTPDAQRITPAAEGSYSGLQKILILKIAALVGATLGVAMVTLRHTTRKGIVDAHGLRDATGLPVLAQFSNRALRGVGKVAHTRPDRSRSGLSQAGRSLQTALALTPQGSKAQVILSTSSIAGEGKTHHAILLAHALGMSGKRVVLIGADAPNPTLKSLLGSEPFALAQDNWRSGEAGTHAANLGADVLIMTDTSDQHAPLMSDQLAQRLKMLRQSYDHIIVDGPPVLLAPEARLIASQSDAIIYAVRWSKTPHYVVQRGLEALDDIGHPATGLILSHINLRKMRQLSSDPCLGALPATQTIWGVP